MSAASPESFGRYRVTGTLGRGAMGAVYRAHDPLIDRMVAIKAIRTELLEGKEREDFLARFRREAQAAGRCAHPNIVAVHDFSDSGETPYLVMELVEGENLRQVLQRGALTPARALAIALAVLDALEYAHAARITHRDIKPANIAILPDGRVKVMDFGIARLNSAALTSAGMMVGTPSYMAPEQVLGTTVDHRCDLFQTGIVLYEMLTGQPPFAGESATQILYKIAHQDLALGTELYELPASFAQILRRALARDPQFRYASAAEFAAALRAIGAGPSPEPAAPDATVFAPRRAAPNMTSPGQDSAPGQDRLDPALLTRVERELASHVGPMARLLVRKAAQTAPDADEFYRRLSENIPEAAERTQFLSRHSSGARATTGAPVPGPRAAPSTSARPEAVSAADIEAAQAALTPFLGPIAKILARKTAAQCRGSDDFHERLAAELESPAQRAEFLRQVRAARAARPFG